MAGEVVVSVWLSPTKVRCWQQCKLAFKRKYQERMVPVGPRPVQLAAGDLLHRCLARFHLDYPQTAADALAMLDDVVMSAIKDFTNDELTAIHGEVAAALIAYQTEVPNFVSPGYQCCTEVPLRARAGPLNLFSRADLLFTSDHVVNCVEWKRSAPQPQIHALQASFLHLGIRQSYTAPETMTIRHMIVSFLPKLSVQTYPLDADVFHEQLRVAFGVAKEIARARSYPPNTESCGGCDYGLTCEHAIGALKAVSF